jgi:hypothetical protein
MEHKVICITIKNMLIYHDYFVISLTRQDSACIFANTFSILDSNIYLSLQNSFSGFNYMKDDTKVS